MGFMADVHTLMNPHTSAETKNLCFKVLNEVSTRIKLLCANCRVSFLLRWEVLIVMKFPEWQPATKMSFNLNPVETRQVIVSVCTDNSTFVCCAFQNLSVQSSETVTSSFSLSFSIWLIPEACSSMLFTGWNLILSLACPILCSFSSILSYALRTNYNEVLLNFGIVSYIISLLAKCERICTWRSMWPF